MNKLKPSLPASSGISLMTCLVSFVWASSQAQAEWTPEACYTRLTNNVATWNPGVPLKNFKVIHADGKTGPQLINRTAVLPLLYPGDQICVKATLSSTGSKGPLNPHALQCHPTGNK